MSIIDSETGSFHISSKIVISKDKLYNEILKLAPKNKTWDITNGYKWIYFKNAIIEGLFFNIDVCFHNEKLFSIDFNFSDKESKIRSWDSWNENEELKQKDLYENWLTKLFGKKRDFEWGKIGAYYDQRGGSTSINIRYH